MIIKSAQTRQTKDGSDYESTALKLTAEDAVKFFEQFQQKIGELESDKQVIYVNVNKFAPLQDGDFRGGLTVNVHTPGQPKKKTKWQPKGGSKINVADKIKQMTSQ
jgi:hypothetical protein